MKADQKRYCGIVFIGGGSSWAWAPTPEEAAEGAARIAKSDWKQLFKFKRKQPFKVCIYDMLNREGWYATDAGVFDQQTKERLTMLRCDTITV